VRGELGKRSRSVKRGSFGKCVSSRKCSGSGKYGGQESKAAGAEVGFKSDTSNYVHTHNLLSPGS
jgi:hypothetical protein